MAWDGVTAIPRPQRNKVPPRPPGPSSLHSCNALSCSLPWAARARSVGPGPHRRQPLPEARPSSRPHPSLGLSTFTYLKPSAESLASRISACSRPVPHPLTGAHTTTHVLITYPTFPDHLTYMHTHNSTHTNILCTLTECGCRDVSCSHCARLVSWSSHSKPMAWASGPSFTGQPHSER